MPTNGIAVEAEVGEVRKDSHSVIRARLLLVCGAPCADVRVFALSSGGEFLPTKAGITVHRSRAEGLRQLVNALSLAAEASNMDSRDREAGARFPVEV